MVLTKGSQKIMCGSIIKSEFGFQKKNNFIDVEKNWSELSCKNKLLIKTK